MKQLEKIKSILQQTQEKLILNNVKEMKITSLSLGGEKQRQINVNLGRSV